MEDLDIHVPGIVSGDADAFGAWMSHAEPVLRDNLRSFAAKVDTEAVLQETLLRLWQVAPRFRADGRPNGLLRLGFRISKNLAISENRRIHTSPVEPAQIAETLEAPPSGTPDPILRRVIELCRSKLPKKPALALAARLGSGGGEPDETLAERLGMTKNTFLQNFGRARKFLMQCLKREGVDLEAELA